MNERSELAQVRIEEMKDSGKEGPPHLLLIGGDPGVLRVPDFVSGCRQTACDHKRAKNTGI